MANIKEAAVPAAINGVINGWLAYSGFSNLTEVPLSVDAISSTEATVLSQGVTVSLALAVILTAITALIVRRHSGAATPPLTVARLAVENALFLFGATVAVAVVWQRAAGVVMVSPLEAALVVAAFAALATVVVDVRTKRGLVGAHPKTLGPPPSDH